MKKPILRFTLALLTLGSLTPSLNALPKNPPQKNSKATQQRLNRELVDAATEGKLTMLKKLLAMGADIETRNDPTWGHMTPLMIAAENDYPELAAYLLDHGAKIHARDRNQNTALHTAVDEGHPKVVKLLLDHGADYRLKNEFGMTPLDLTGRPDMPAGDEENEQDIKLIEQQMAKDKKNHKLFSKK